ncbi:MAG: radical SAM protein [Candidatus Shapirobacteria bacterium]
MTKILFIQKDFENIGIEYLSANLKLHGQVVDLIYFSYPISDNSQNQAIKAKIDSFKPDIVAFSPFSSQFWWSVLKSRFIKTINPNIFILFGGVHVNSVPQEILKEIVIDGIILGEADYTLVQFATNFHSNYTKTPSLWFRKGNKIVKNPLSPLITDLDILPPPDKDLFFNLMPKGLKSLPYSVMGSRGCPFACSYCSNNIYQKLYMGQKRLRYRNPDNITSELVNAYVKYKFSRVEFSDDVLAIDMDRLKNLMLLYKKKVNLPFACFFHPQLVTDQTVKYLLEGGCDWMKLGIQSANEEYRHKYLNRHETNASVLKVSQLCHKYGLGFSFDHIFNLPGETKDHLIEAIIFYNQCRPSTINFGGLMYLPGTDIVNLGLQFGDITKTDLKLINQGRHQLSRQYKVPWYFYKKNEQSYNPSIIMLMFILITILPQSIVNFLIRIKLYDWPISIPNIVIVPLKIISKFKGHQFYLYTDGVRQRVVKKIAGFTGT